MIEARKLRLWDGRYDLLEDGRWVATWERSDWATGGRFVLDGRSFTVRANLLADEASLTEAGRQVATMRGFSRKNWTIEADGTTYHFCRAAPWRREERLHEGGRRVGRVKRSNLWRGDAAADTFRASHVWWRSSPSPWP